MKRDNICGFRWLLALITRDGHPCRWPRGRSRRRLSLSQVQEVEGACMSVLRVCVLVGGEEEGEVEGGGKGSPCQVGLHVGRWKALKTQVSWVGFQS